MSKPMLLDLFCGAGGCSMGYCLAGFDIVGVDLHPQPSYPFQFVQADALDYLAHTDLSQYAAIHASPPCQLFSLATHFHGTQDKHPDLIAPIRAWLQTSGKPYIIENVMNAPLERSVLLCGAMFGLRTYRHRLFESNCLLFQPHHPEHTVKAAKPGAIARPDEYWSVGGHFGRKDDAQRAMGIDWMKTQKEIAQAIPPAYTQWIGEQLLCYVTCSTEKERKEHSYV